MCRRHHHPVGRPTRQQSACRTSPSVRLLTLKTGSETSQSGPEAAGKQPAIHHQHSTGRRASQQPGCTHPYQTHALTAGYDGCNPLPMNAPGTRQAATPAEACLLLVQCRLCNNCAECSKAKAQRIPTQATPTAWHACKVCRASQSALQIRHLHLAHTANKQSLPHSSSTHPILILNTMRNTPRQPVHSLLAMKAALHARTPLYRALAMWMPLSGHSPTIPTPSPGRRLNHAAAVRLQHVLDPTPSKCQDHHGICTVNVQHTRPWPANPTLVKPLTLQIAPKSHKRLEH